MSIVQGEETRGSSSGGGTSTYQYPQLMTSNYTSWAIRVQAIMEDQGIWAAVQPAAKAAVDLKQDRKAKAHLLQALPEDLLMQVAKKVSSKEIWESLKTRFVGADRVRNARLQALKSDFDAFRMVDGESLDQYAGRMTSMSVKYSNVGGTLQNEAMVKKLFDTIPDRFLHVIAGIEQFCNIDTMPFEEALSQLKAYEERTGTRAPGGGVIVKGQLLLTQADWESRRKKNGDDTLSQKGKSSTEGKNRGRSGRSRGKGSRGETQHTNGAGSSGSGSRDKSHIRCYNCNEMGHYSTQ